MVFARAHQGQHHECLSFSPFTLILFSMEKVTVPDTLSIRSPNLPQCGNRRLFSRTHLCQQHLGSLWCCHISFPFQRSLWETAWFSRVRHPTAPSIDCLDPPPPRACYCRLLGAFTELFTVWQLHRSLGTHAIFALFLGIRATSEC